MPPVKRHPLKSTSTEFWLCNSTHSSPGSFTAGWYMISLNTTTLSACAGGPAQRKTAATTMRRIGEGYRGFMSLSGLVSTMVLQGRGVRGTRAVGRIVLAAGIAGLSKVDGGSSTKIAANPTVRTVREYPNTAMK